MAFGNNAQVWNEFGGRGLFWVEGEGVFYRQRRTGTLFLVAGTGGNSLVGWERVYSNLFEGLGEKIQT